MNVVLFQRVARRPIPDGLSGRAEKKSTRTEMVAALSDEISAVIDEVSDPHERVYAMFETLSRRTGIAPRRIKMFWYREVKRIDAVEVEVFRRLRAEHARRRLERAEHEMAIARAMVARGAA